MPAKSYADVDKTFLDIRSLKEQNKTDKEIMETLKLPRSTYQRYMNKLHTEYRKAWNNLVETQMEKELMKLKESLEHTYETALDISKDKEDTITALQALYVKDQARQNIINLLVQGPRIIIQNKNLMDNDNKESSNIQIRFTNQQQ